MSDAIHYRLKAAQRDLIARCGGIARCVELTSFSQSQVGRWNNPNDPELMPLGAIVVLEGDCRHPLVTAVLADNSGRRLTVPDVEFQQEIGVLTSHAEVMRQSAEISHTLAQVISDGRVTPSEAQTLDRPAAAMEASLSKFRMSLAGIKARGGEAASLRIVGDA
ncbi:hypothetical protein [Rhizobium sp. AAP43]|uniref:hypothetical protein n=1 Tax=Rhizobium sp. AAP43 TaxID=1523420 RepID=UPI0006CD32E4|nr:hypothetical protein [Rhizobium sp. AAP43]KPF47112.1 hypothetical protein IP76_01970 [Rhizobium sp. AAP43]